MRPGQGRCLRTLKGCQSEEEEAQPGCGGQRQGCYRASQEGGSPSSLGVCKQAQSLESVVGGKVTLEVGFPFCAKPCAKCRALRDVSDLVSTPRSPHLGVCRPKPNNLRES